MVETAGRKLQQARVRKQISIEDAARATRVRPDKIIDLENDNYANFPNIAYARGFLLIYAKFLGVDVNDFAETLENTNPVAIDEYEYLNAPTDHRPIVHYAPQRNSLMPLLIGALLLIAVAIILYIFLSLQRLGPLEQIAEKKEGIVPDSPTPSAITMTTPTRAPAIVASISPASASQERSAISTVSASPGASAEAASPAASAPAVAVPSPASAAAADTPALPLKEIVLKPSRKTWVKIRKDVADSAPAFEDWLYPDAPPLKLRGTRFWIELRDPGAVEITRDGQPVPAGQPSIAIE